jgi:hypothetical protein
LASLDVSIHVNFMWLQEFLVNFSTGKSCGWRNWLSLGMLGAGGTNDLGQFSGAVSDAVIKVLLDQLINYVAENNIVSKFKCCLFVMCPGYV